MRELGRKFLVVIIAIGGLISIPALRWLSVAYSPIDLHDNSWISILYAWGATIFSAVIGLLIVKFGTEIFDKPES